MAKKIEKDGKFYRLRRGKLVEIPEEWVGKTVHPKTIRQRPSKKIHKRRKDEGWKLHSRKGSNFRKMQRKIAEERE